MKQFCILIAALLAGGIFSVNAQETGLENNQKAKSGYISPAFSVGFLNIKNPVNVIYDSYYDRHYLDDQSYYLDSGSQSLSWTSIAFDVAFVSSSGLQFCFQQATSFSIGKGVFSEVGFGIGYAYNGLKNITIDGALMYLPFGINMVGDGAPGLRLGATYWINDYGVTCLFNYYDFVASDMEIISLRLGLSLKF